MTDKEKEEEYLWIDKYKPLTLKDLTYNSSTTKILRSLAQSDDFPHLIFYGIEGAGKKTRINAFLEEVYGEGVRKVNSEYKELKINSQTVEYLVTSSNYHIELSPSDLENKDRILIQNVIKEAASVSQLNQSSQKRFKVVVLMEADNLTRDAQAALRRTMEKYSSNCRIIMSCNSLNKILAPIRSRCLSIRVGAPNKDEIKSVLTKIAEEERIQISDNQLDKIIQASEGNMRKAINTLQLTEMGSYGNDIYMPEYITAIQSVVDTIKNKRNMAGIKDVRTILMKLMVCCIPVDVIILTMMKEILKISFINDNQKQQIINLASFYDKRAMNGTKAIFHLEAFVAKVMCVIG